MKISITAYAILLISSFSLLIYAAELEKENGKDIPSPDTVACLTQMEFKVSQIVIPDHIKHVESVIRRKNNELVAEKSLFQIFEEKLKVKGMDELNPEKYIKDLCTEFAEDIMKIIYNTDCGLSVYKGLDQKGLIALMDSYPRWKEAQVAVKLCPIAYK